MKTPYITPQGKILLIKGLSGIFTGILVTFLYNRFLTGPQTFTLTVLIYTVISFLVSGIARQVNPPISIGLYSFFKGIMTFYISLFLTWLSIYIFIST